MKTKVLDKETSDKISFIAFIIPAFAEAYKMNMQQAYFYLKKYGGLDFLGSTGNCVESSNFAAWKNIREVRY
ncbi:hypothetical protein AGMMS4957_21940 [Bacteroidia bacterium]|nr:hypothetical protein AGMMS4957_21940 [Bacteroidia bacterium]